ncbi:hypothetical protein ES702_02014 [subsurface metagenome]
MTIADVFMLGFTLAIAISTYLLWKQTKRSYELSLFLHFTEFIRQSKGVQEKPGRSVSVEVNQIFYHPKLLFRVLNKAFPEEFKRFIELFELDKEVRK